MNNEVKFCNGICLKLCLLQPQVYPISAALCFNFISKTCQTLKNMASLHMEISSREIQLQISIESFQLGKVPIIFVTEMENVW